MSGLRKNPKRNTKRKRTAQQLAGGDTRVGILSFFPTRAHCTMPYVQDLTLTSYNSATYFGSAQVFRLNSLFDPDLTGTGHQPYSFDQITPFYARNLVKSVDVEITFSDPSSDGMLVGIFARNEFDATVLTGASISQASERPTVWMKPLNNTGSQNVVFKKHYNLAAFMGLTQAQYNGAYVTTGATTTTNPDRPAYLEIAVADTNASTSASVKLRVRLYFHAEFFCRVQTSQS